MSGVRWRVGWPVASGGGRWPVEGGVAGGRCGGASVWRCDYHNYDNDYEDDDDNDFSNYEYCGLGACALVIEHEHYYALVIGCSQT